MIMTPGELLRQLLQTISRRPMTASELALDLGKRPDELAHVLDRLVHDGQISRIDRGLGVEYCLAADREAWTARRDERSLGASGIRVAGGASPSR